MNVEQDNIVKKLKSYGEIENTEFITKKDKLYCVVKYKNKDDALSVYSETSEMFGKNVKVLPYRDLGDNKKLDHYNTLFFNLETVIKRIAECERLEDYNIVDIKDKDLATRMALLETHLVNQTKEFLKRNNIDLDNLTNEKNKKVLIVRNINVEKCLDFVEKGCKISIAPSRTVALIKFDEEEKAYRCYKKLNLKRFEDTVVYCEFAPLCKISTIETKDVPVESNNDNKLNKLLVKNVPFQASKDEIFKLFSGKFKVLDVRIPQKRDGCSRGFAFVTFDSPETVKKVIEYFGKSTHLYGRRLVLEMAKE